MPDRRTGTVLGLVGLMAGVVSLACFGLAVLLYPFLAARDSERTLTELTQHERELITRADQMLIIHMAVAGVLLFGYAVFTLLCAFGLRPGLYAGVALGQRIGWEVNAALWLALIGLFSTLGVSSDWSIQLLQAGLMLTLAAACFLRATNALASAARQRRWTFVIAGCLVGWVLVDWLSQAFTPDALREVNEAFSRANEAYWLSAQGGGLNEVFGTLPWLTVAGIYLLSGPGRPLSHYLMGGPGYPEAIRHFGIWLQARAVALEPWLLLVAVIASWAAQIVSLIPVWVVLAVPALGLWRALATATGDTVEANTERRDALIERTRPALLLLFSLGALLVGEELLSLGAPLLAVAGGQTEQVGAPSTVQVVFVLGVLSFVAVVAQYLVVVVWPYHRGQAPWKRTQVERTRAALRSAEVDLGAQLTEHPPTSSRLSDLVRADFGLHLRQGRQAFAAARAQEAQNIPVIPIKTVGDLARVIARASALSAVVSPVLTASSGGHAGGGSMSALPGELLKLLAEFLPKSAAT